MSTGIEWTDETSAEKEIHHGAVVVERWADQLECLPRETGDPRDRVVVSFCAVTRGARRDHVAPNGLATESDRDDVVEADCSTAAVVGAEALGRNEKKVLAGLRTDVSHVPPSSGRLAALVAPARPSVVLSIDLIAVHSAGSATNIIGIRPVSTSATPRPAIASRIRPFALCRAIGSSNERRLASSSEPVATRSVSAESSARMPTTAWTAPLLASGLPRCVLVDGDPDPRGSNLQHSGRRTHGPSISRPSDIQVA